MMATHGCGQRIGFGRFLGLAALVALALGGVPGAAQACHLRHAKATTHHTTLGAETASPASGNGTLHSQQILSPTSLVPQLPPLTPTTAPTITATAAPAPVMTIPVTSLTPSPLTNPPAAEQIVPAAPPAIATWHDAGTPTCTTTVPLTAPTNVPVTAPPAAAQALNPPAPFLPPLATNTPEPASIVSALVMIGAAAAWRRSRRPG